MKIVTRQSDSLVDIIMMSDQSIVSSADVTRCDLVLKRAGVDDFVISSDDESQDDWFVLQAPLNSGGRAHAVIRLNLKDIPDPPPIGTYEAHVFIWDDVYTNGRFWGTFTIELRGEAAP